MLVKLSFCEVNMRISACMIAKNEEKNIRACIESYKDIVDQIVVVDTGSTDGTKDIAQALGAEVYSIEWNNDFAAAKNFALSKAVGDWIIFMDADEYFAASKSKNVLSTIKKIDARKDIDGISCRMINIDQDTGDILVDNTHMRIFRNNENLRYKFSIHERVVKFNGLLKNYHATNDEFVIYHTGYSSSKRKDKARRNLEMLLAIREDDNFYDLYISDCHLVLENWEESIEYANKAINTADSLYDFSAKPYENIATSMINLEREKAEIIDFLDICTEKFEFHPLFYYQKGAVYFNDNQYNKAFQFIKKAVELNTNYSSNEQNKCVGSNYKMLLLLGVIQSKRNNLEEAEKLFKASLLQKKHNNQAFNELIKCTSEYTLDKRINVINSIYSFSDEEDYKFIIENLARLKEGKLLAFYYGKKIEEPKNTDVYFILTLITNGMYQDAFNILMKLPGISESKEIANLCAAVTLLSNSYYNFKVFKSQIKENAGLISVLSYYFGEMNEKVAEDDYLSVLSEVIHYKNTLVISNMMKLSFQMEGTTAKLATDLLFLNGLYEDAVIYYYQIISSNNINAIILDSLKKMAYSYFYLGNYISSLLLIEMYFANGGKETEIFEYVSWIKEKNTDSKLIREVCRAILTYNQYSGEVSNFTDHKSRVAHFIEVTQSVQLIKNAIEKSINDGKISDAKRLIDESCSVIAEDPDMLCYRCVISIMENDLDAAEECATVGLSIDGEHSDLLYNYAYIKECLGEVQQAVELYRRAYDSQDSVEMKAIIEQQIRKLES